MERRLLLVFALTFLIIMLFQPLLKKYVPQPPEKPSSSQTSAGQTPAQPQMPPGAATSNAAPPSTGPVPRVAPQEASSESETVIENGLYRIVFSNRGAQVKSWVLKKYTDDHEKPLELVNATAAEKYGYPLSLWTYDENLRNKLNSALYVPASSSATAPAEINFVYSDSDVSVRKTFRFDHSYVVETQTSVVVRGSAVTAFPMWPSGFGDQTNGPQYAGAQIAYQFDNKVEQLAIKKVSGGGTLQGPFHWAGISDQYFAAVFLPQDPQNAAMVTLRNIIEIPHGGDSKQMDKVDVLGAAVGNLKGTTAARLYVGPKSLSDLESVAVPGITGAPPDLRALIDFGWLGVIARPLFIWLKWMYYHIVPNWGWAIVLQTVIINIALLPLRLYQMRYSLKMARIQPQIKAIQEKYKKYSMKDPRRQDMQKEMWEVQQKEGVNPVTGCLPMLLPLFLLWPYYRMLTVAIDLRHAPWLWIRDLSAPDPLPLHILAVGIIISMFVMQRMTPQAGIDPAQQRMMNFMMPAMMGYLFWNLAAGLSLYFLASNLMGTAQQFIMNRTALGREMREMMEKRARKKEK